MRKKELQLILEEGGEISENLEAALEQFSSIYHDLEQKIK